MRKNKLINFLKTGILFFGISLLLWSCENESITSEEMDISSKQISEISFDELPFNLKETVTNSNTLFKAKSSNTSKALIYDYNRILKKVNSLELTNYSARFYMKNQPKNILYNLILFNKESNREPFVLKFIIENIEEITQGDGRIDFSSMKGVIERYNFQDFIANNSYNSRGGSNDPCNTYSSPFSGADGTPSGGGGGGGGRRSSIEWGDGQFSFDTGRGGSSGHEQRSAYNNNNNRCDDKNQNGEQSGGGAGGSVGINGGGNNNEPDCPNGRIVNGECVEEEDDKIFNELTGKDLCVFNELKKLGLFKSTIGKFSKGNYDLTFKYGSKCNDGAGEEACTDASDLHNGNITIKILGSGTQSLDFAATLLHEGIHAEIYKYVDENKKGIDPNDRKSVFHYYNYYSAKNNDRRETSIAQHQHMQDVFVIPIAKAIRKLDNYRLPLENYYGFGWEGLKTDYKYDNYIDMNEKLQVMTPEKYRDYINKMYNVISTTKFKEVLKNCN